MAPLWVTGWGGGPMSKVTVHLLLEEMPWLDFNQTWQESSSGAGDSKVFIWYMWPPWGPGGGPQGPKT